MARVLVVGVALIPHGESTAFESRAVFSSAVMITTANGRRTWIAERDHAAHPLHPKEACLWDYFDPFVERVARNAPGVRLAPNDITLCYSYADPGTSARRLLTRAATDCRLGIL